ncbi:uncharacterized protein [Pagrus major]|uniref:uncharacterized protein n=1 Tax=Pagrus major TaxID=143350 RepID=UPI003CC867C0
MTHREPQMSFPRFLDVKGLLNQDFLLLFGAETASKMLEKWDTTFRPKVINEARRLTQSIEVCRLLKTAEKLTENDDTTWDSDMASLLLRLHLLPPTAGQKRTKISPSDAVDKMLHFHKGLRWWMREEFLLVGLTWLQRQLRFPHYTHFSLVLCCLENGKPTAVTS